MGTRYYPAIRSIESVWRAPIIRADHLLLITSERRRTGRLKPRHDFYKTIMEHNETFPRDGKRREFELREKFCQFSGVTMVADTGGTVKEQWDASPLLHRPALSELIRTLSDRSRPETSSYRIYASFDVARLGTHSGEFIRAIYSESGAIWIPNVPRLSSVRIIVANSQH